LSSVTTSKINIPLTKYIHNQSIGCTARNSQGTTNTTIRLLIRCETKRKRLMVEYCFVFLLDPPMILVRPPKLVILDTDRRLSSTVRCLVDSYPRARITWYRFGDLIGQGSILNLENITKHNEQGVYVYRIETDGFEPIEEEFIVHIKGYFRRKLFDFY